MNVNDDILKIYTGLNLKSTLCSNTPRPIEGANCLDFEPEVVVDEIVNLRGCLIFHIFFCKYRF